MKLDTTQTEKPIIKVIGVGGGGGNAVGYMFRQGIIGVDFAICNTDKQALENNPVPHKINLGPTVSNGRGAGSKPEIGKEACIESIDDVRAFINDGTKMLFITAGMGGGTGTGAAPIIAKVAKEMGILTVGIVTLPFQFEGMRRRKHAIEGLENMKKNVDAILVISNDKIQSMYGNEEFQIACTKADDILTMAAKSIAEIITVPGYINVDFEDVNYVMKDSGVALMGSGSADGDNRAMKAIQTALSSPLLEENDIRGAKNILLNITSGSKPVTMNEVTEITKYVEEEAGFVTDLIWGNSTDEALGDKISVTIIATGFEPIGRKSKLVEPQPEKQVKLEDDAFEIITETDSFSILDVTKNSTTVEFDDDDVNKVIEEYGVKGKFTSFFPPVTRNEKMDQEEMIKRMEMETTRREYARQSFTKPLDSPDAIEHAEKIPAYIRRGMTLQKDQQGDLFAKNEKVTMAIDREGTIITTGGNTFLNEEAD
jgi:cell division protein FtsZ